MPAFLIFVLAIALLAPIRLVAQVLPMPLAPIAAGAAPVRVDGLLDDDAWANTTPYSSFRQFRPSTQSDVGPYRTEVRVLMERGALVFGIRAWDPEPASIRAPLARRDQIFPDQDAVTIWLDTHGRSEIAQFVRINAAGSIADGIYRASDDDDDSTPDFLDIEVATHRLQDGYSVELRWPLSVLRYPLNGRLPWGMMVTRRVPREASMAFASAPIERNQPHLLMQLQRFDVDTPLREQLDHQQHLRVRAEGTARTLDGGDGNRATTANLGLELQWRPRADWVVDAIVKPDFSQVELDEPQLSGNTRFALFQTEKRTFFLESSDVVGQIPPDNLGVSRGLLAFYSRAIADPRFGLRATYRGNESEATALVLNDAGGGVVLRPDAFGTKNFEVSQASRVLFARHRSQIGSKASVAGIVSLREWSEGIGTQVGGIDAQVDLDDVNQIRGHVLFSNDSTALPLGGDTPVATVSKGPNQAGTATWLSWRHRGDDWRWSAHWEQISPRFVNDNGFVPQSGIQRGTIDMSRLVHSEHKEISAWELLLRATHTRAMEDSATGVAQAQLASELLQPGMWIMNPAETEGWLYLNLDRTRTRFGGTVHQPRSVLLGAAAHPGPRLTFVSLEATLGERVDVEADRVGQGYSTNTQITWRDTLGPWGLELEQRASRGRIYGPQGNAALDEGSAQTKVVLHINAEQAVRLVVQKQSFSRAADAQLPQADSTSRIATLAWLARSGALRGWSAGTTWAQETGQSAKREWFVKYQQGWAWH
jgi:hypothetical protein